MVGVILGTGVFGGYCIGGNLQSGRDGVAGEWGHLPIAPEIRDRYSGYHADLLELNPDMTPHRIWRAGMPIEPTP